MQATRTSYLSDSLDGLPDKDRQSAKTRDNRESGCYAPTTFSKNMQRVPQNEAPAHGFSGGRTAQGTMSRSPEAAAQSGKASALDSLPDKDGQSAKTRDTSASCRYAQPSCSPEDGNHYDQDTSISTDNPQPEGLTGPTAGGSCVEISDAATTSCASTISTNPSQDAPHGNAGVDMTDAGNGAASKSPTSCDTLTADGDIREDSQAKPDGSAITRNETRHIDALDSSANHYGDSDTSDGSDVSTTVSIL